MASSSTRKISPRASRLAVVGLVLALLSPLTVFVAIAGLKAGLFDIGVAYDTLTMQAALYLAGLGVLGAILALVGAVRAFRTSGLIAVAAVVVSVASVSLFVREIGTESRHASEAPGATTDPADPVGFSNAIMSERRAEKADSLVGENGSCGISHLPTQTAPGVAGYALQEAGFDIRDIGVNRANGVHTSFWFDRTYDAAIRIRPGRTDVRVAPRDGAHDHGTSCRLAQKILTALQPTR